MTSEREQEIRAKLVEREGTGQGFLTIFLDDLRDLLAALDAARAELADHACHKVLSDMKTRAEKAEAQVKEIEAELEKARAECSARKEG